MSSTIDLNPSDLSFKLTRIAEDDAAFLFELMLSPDYLEFVGDRQVRTVQQASDYISDYFSERGNPEGLGYFVIRNSGGAPMGMVGLLKRDFMEHPDLGFAVLPQYYRLGVAYEGSRQLMLHVQETMALKQIDAFTHERNTASQRLLEKLQFQRGRGFTHPESGEGLLSYTRTL